MASLDPPLHKDGELKCLQLTCDSIAGVHFPKIGLHRLRLAASAERTPLKTKQRSLTPVHNIAAVVYSVYFCLDVH